MGREIRRVPANWEHPTDRELWRERDGDFYADSIHVTERGGIGINCGGSVFVKPIREWHALATSPPKPDAVEKTVDLLNEFEKLTLDANDPQLTSKAYLPVVMRLNEVRMILQSYVPPALPDSPAPGLMKEEK